MKQGIGARINTTTAPETLGTALSSLVPSTETVTMAEMAVITPFGFSFEIGRFLTAWRGLGATRAQFYRNEQKPPTVAAALKAATSAGFTFDSMHGAFGEHLDPSSPDPEHRTHCLHTYAAEGELALALGGPMVVVHPSCWNPGRREMTREQIEATSAVRWPHLHDFMARLAEIGGRQGVTYLIENQPMNCPLGHDVARLAQAVREIHSPHIRMCLDTGHAHITGDVSRALHDAADGGLVWSCGGFNPDATPLWPAVATPAVANGMAVVCFGRADRGLPRLHGIKLGGSGDVTKSHRAWMREDAGSFVPSPVEYKGLIYILSDRGQVECIDPLTGRTLWSDALPRASSNFYASPMIANGILYAAREDGTVFVARIEGGYQFLSENKFEDRVIASIVPVGDRLLVRGEANLYCVAVR